MKWAGSQRPCLHAHAQPARAGLTLQWEMWRAEKAVCRVDSGRWTEQSSGQYWWSLWSPVVVAQGPDDSNSETQHGRAGTELVSEFPVAAAPSSRWRVASLNSWLSRSS